MKGSLQGGNHMDNGASSYRRFLDGEEEAFDEIMKELFHGLVYFINRYVQDLHTAEDLAIDSLSDLIVHPKRYNFQTTLKTYLFMIGRSRALDYIKRKKIIHFTELSEANMLEDFAALEENILADQRKKAVHDAIAKLPGDMAEAVYLIYFEELSYQDAGTIMKKSRKQVDNLLYRAKKELRNILGEDGEQLL